MSLLRACRRPSPNSNTPARKSRLVATASWPTLNSWCPGRNSKRKWLLSIATPQATRAPGDRVVAHAAHVCRAAVFWFLR
uniref:Uncharacterized protein n=1 Tax=Pseudomonas savastanoi TaxID=29438 RepID=Q52508_PSESS|nr:unknown protein [Pseudomonas savastanoi]